MRRNTITLAACALFALGGITPSQAQNHTAVAQLLPGQTAVVSVANTRIATPFDGRRVNAALARNVAGDRQLIGWANCAGQLGSDGMVAQIEPGARRRLGPDVACLYLATGEQDDFQEFFVTEAECDESASGANACLDGFAVDTRVRNRVTTRTTDTELRVTVERTFFFATVAANQVPSSGVDTGGRRSTVDNTQLALRMDRIGSARCNYTFTLLTRRSTCQAFNASGRRIGNPIVTEVNIYVDYNNPMTELGGATSCAELGNMAEADAAAQNEIATTILGFADNFATGTGALVGFVGGLQISKNAAKIGSIIGGGLGRGAVGLHELAMEYGGPVRAAFVGSVIETACEGMEMFRGTPTTPGDATPPPLPTNPGATGQASTGEQTLCYVCTKEQETTITVIDNETGEVVETYTIVICIEMDWVPC